VSSYPQKDGYRERLYAEIIKVMRDRGIGKRAAIAVLNQHFNASTRDDLNNEQLDQFLSLLQEIATEGAA
jgi:hypothetical protein